MIKKGILKGAKRAPFLGEPFKKALDTFRREVLGREDFDPTALLQFGLFMSKAVINILKENEAKFGVDGQIAVNDALIKTGYDVGKEIIEGAEIPEGISESINNTLHHIPLNQQSKMRSIAHLIYSGALYKTSIEHLIVEFKGIWCKVLLMLSENQILIIKITK